MTSLKIGIFGHEKSNTTSTVFESATKIGQLIAINGHTLYNGGGAGVMLSARQGAFSEHGSIVSINPDQAIEDIHNNMLGNIVMTGQNKIGRVPILCQTIDIGFALSGGAGTLLEIITCYLLAKPIIVIDFNNFSASSRVNQFFYKTNTIALNGKNFEIGYLDDKDSKYVSPILILNIEIGIENIFSLGIEYYKNITGDKCL
ncbi:MAG: hypothetical protein FDX21_08170 [Chlorobium sp.]|nr:MAG: hypothetical protein FDX21_08170 [Chlorobium sp.]